MKSLMGKHLVSISTSGILNKSIISKYHSKCERQIEKKTRLGLFGNPLHQSPNLQNVDKGLRDKIK